LIAGKHIYIYIYGISWSVYKHVYAVKMHTLYLFKKNDQDGNYYEPKITFSLLGELKDATSIFDKLFINKS